MLRSKHLQKTVLLLVLIAAMLSVTACGNADQTPTLTVTAVQWSGWSKEQPAPTEDTFENVKKGTVVYDGFGGTVTAVRVSNDSVELRLDNSVFVEPNEDGTINLTAESIESVTIKRGEEKRIDTATLDGGVRLIIRYS